MRADPRVLARELEHALERLDALERSLSDRGSISVGPEGYTRREETASSGVSQNDLARMREKLLTLTARQVADLRGEIHGRFEALEARIAEALAPKSESESEA